MIGGLLRRNKAKNSGLVPLHSRNLVLGMPGTDESSSERHAASEDEHDQEMADAFRPHDDCTVARETRGSLEVETSW